MDGGKDGCYLSLPQQMKVKTLPCKESTFLSAHSSKAETCDGHVVHMACLTCTSVGHTGINTHFQAAYATQSKWCVSQKNHCLFQWADVCTYSEYSS